jgi:hypothetical protein
MIVFDPAIFRLPVLRRRRCATKLQRQPEVAAHDGRRGSQRGWVGGALDTRGSNRLRVPNGANPYWDGWDESPHFLSGLDVLFIIPLTFKRKKVTI